MNLFRLRRTCLSPQVYQQACRASTRARRTRPRISNLRSLFQDDLFDDAQGQPDAGNDGISWFEQDPKSGKVSNVAGNPEELEADELRYRIKRLEQRLKKYESNQDEDTLEPALLEALEPDERVKVEQALQERRDKKMALTTGLEIPLDPNPLAVPLLRRLNKVLGEAALDPANVDRRKELWRWYTRAKRNIPGLARTMPTGAWKVLWDTQTISGLHNPELSSHILEMFDDMISGGLELTNEQKGTRLGALIATGRLETAYKEWETEYNATSGGDSHNLERGIILHSNSEQLQDRPLDITDLLRRYFEVAQFPDARVILPVIKYHVALRRLHMAFALYILLRAKLKQDMLMSDYDAVVSIFLEHNHKDLALAVFRDMMMKDGRALQGDIRPLDSMEHRQLSTALNKRLRGLQARADTAEDLNKINLAALAILPYQWSNRFFFASWMKKLLGEGDIPAAEKVVELMFERNIRPDPKHMNGLIGAYMRSGQSELQDSGEQLAWSMIYKRLEFVAERDKDGDKPRLTAGEQIWEEDLDIRVDVVRPLPSANIETFNLLALHYLIQERWAHFRHLYRMLRPAKIEMSSFFLNHLLYMQLYTNGPAPTWRDFLFHRKYVIPGPDAETFNCLWTANLRLMEPFRKYKEREFPTSRELFYTMAKWHDKLTDRQKLKAREFFSLEIYAKILQSFCEQRDYQGALVAMHGVKKMFGAYPDAEIARILTTSISNLPEISVPRVAGRRGRRQIPVSQARLNSVAEVLKALADRRAQAAEQHGISVTIYTPEQRAQEKLHLLSELLRAVMVRSGGDVDQLEPSIERVSHQMGVPGISTGDVDASNVR